jgi:alpha-ribazole phosphatase
MHIYLVRHPQPGGIDGLCYGRLDVTVERQTLLDTAESVFIHIPRQALAKAPVYSSPSSRCLTFARYLAHPREPVAAGDLAEMSFGHWEGMAWGAIAREQIDAWAVDAWGYRPGGGESATMVETRWLRWLDSTRRTDADCVIAVTHAGVIRVALAAAAAAAAAGEAEAPTPARCAAALEAHIPFGSVHRLNFA